MDGFAATSPAKEFSRDRRSAMGRRLRSLRQARDLTLHQVAEASGVSVSTLSRVERGLMALAYDRFMALARALGVDMAALFADGGECFESGRIYHSRRDEGEVHETNVYTYQMLFPAVWGKTMTPMIGILKPNDVLLLEHPRGHPGQEFVHVLEGTVIARFEGSAPLVLEPGDSLYVDANVGHLYAAANQPKARILVVCTA
ncbi:MAG: helix-turn-helix domain-containing protein [Gemmobacter sp.]